MKKILYLSLTLMILAIPAFSQQLAPSGMFDFPSQIQLGDTINIDARFQFPFMDTLLSEPITIKVMAANAVDTIDLCYGSIETIEQGVVAYTFSCEIPEDFQLGDYHLIFIINTVFGEFVIGGSHPFRVTSNHDLTGDGNMDIEDLVYLVDYQFNDGYPPVTGLSNMDLDCNRIHDISDVVTMVDYMFNDGNLPCYSGN